MFLTNEQYEHAMQINESIIEPGPLLSEFAFWFNQSYHLKLYDYFCDCPNGLTRLQLVLWENSSYLLFTNDKWRNPDERKIAVIAKKFAELCRKYDVLPDYQNGEKIFVCFESLCDEIEKRVLKLAYEEVKALDIPDLWKVACGSSSFHIFFETDEQAKRHQADGVCDSIRNACSEILKKYDKYNVFDRGASCRYTSRQTLNEKYDGSFGHYWNDN